MYVKGDIVLSFPYTHSNCTKYKIYIQIFMYVKGDIVLSFPYTHSNCTKYKI